MRIRTFVMFACLFLLVYCLYAGKGSVMGPLLGVAAVTGDRRKKRLLELKGKIAECDRARKAIFDKCDSEERTENEDERRECVRLETEKRGFIEEHDFLESRASESGDRPPDNGRSVPFEAPSSPASNSFGDRFVGDRAVEAWRADGALGRSPNVRVGSFFPQQRDLVTAGSVTSGGAFIQPRIETTIESIWRRPLTIKDLVTMGNTSTPVTFIKESFTNNADLVAEATGVNDGSGAVPQSDISFLRVEETIKDIGHWVPVTQNALMDAGQVRSEIDGALIQGIDEKLEDTIVTKVLAATDLSLQAFDTDIFTTTRKAKTKVQRVGRAQPTAYAFSPETQEVLDLAQNNQGTFYALGAPFGNAPATLWGVPRITSLTPKLGYVGDASPYGILADWKRFWVYDALESTIHIFDQHGFMAIERVAAIMGIYRAALAVKREQAFCRIAFS